MAFSLQNNFDGGPDGTSISIANSGQVPGNNPFDDVSISSPSATLKYDASQARPTAEFVLKCQIGSSSGFARVAWWSFGSANQLYFRFYGNYPTLPTNVNPGLVIYFGSVGENAMFTVDCPAIPTTLSIRAGGSRTQLVTTTNGLTAGEWWRVEGRLQFSTTTGNGELRAFFGADVDSDTPTESLSFSSANLVDTASDTVFVGYVNAAGSLFNPLYISGLALSDIGWIGPAPFRQKSSPGILTNAVAIHSDTW